MATSPTLEPPNENAGPQKKSICKVCGKTFNKPQLLGAHKRIAHPGAPTQGHSKSAVTHPFRCKECNARFPRASELGAHRRLKHGVKGTSPAAVYAQKHKTNTPRAVAPPCAICGHVFTGMYGVAQHRKAHERKGELISEQFTKRSTTNNGNSAGVTHGEDEVAVAFWVSQAVAEFKTICSNHAQRVELLPEDFASRVLAVVQGSSKTLRARYRLPN